jgi:hypothetical protein
MADTASFISPARIKVLLVPIHPIKRAKFERYSDLIRNYGRIQLADVPADIRGERGTFWLYCVLFWFLDANVMAIEGRERTEG